MKIQIILLLSLVAFYNAESIISFKSDECFLNTLAHKSYFLRIASKFFPLEHLNLLAVGAKTHKIIELLEHIPIIKNCISEIIPSSEIKLDLPQAIKGDEEFIEWHLKRINVLLK